MKHSVLLKSICSLLLLLFPFSKEGWASVLLEQNFDSLNVGVLDAQAGWAAYSGSAHATVEENSEVAHSAPKYLKIAGVTGSAVDIRRGNFPSSDFLSDTTNNHFQFYFRPDNASPEMGNKTHLNIYLYGNQGAQRVLEAQIRFASSEIALTNDATTSWNTVIPFEAPLVEGSWYLFDLVMLPSLSSYQLTITDAESSVELLSGTYLFRNTDVPITRIARLDFTTNTNGRLDWYIDDLTIASIPEPRALLSFSLVAVALMALRSRSGAFCHIKP